MDPSSSALLPDSPSAVVCAPGWGEATGACEDELHAAVRISRSAHGEARRRIGAVVKIICVWNCNSIAKSVQIQGITS